MPNELPDQYELKKLAEPFYHHRLSGGEGDMLIAKALYAYHHKTAHMICELNPYSCLPNTMSVGAMSNVLGRYPGLLYAPIEIKGDAEVHALSRCQMILTEAKRRAQQEFDTASQQTGISLDRIRRYEAEHPSVTRVSYRVPHSGVAATAANYMLSLAKLI
jgi:predicted nucleotide-binding protein (sugar kinase/HSP70/actin superfamily)